MNFISTAWAMGTPPAGAEASPTAAVMQFVPLILMLVIFYFLLIRPQQKRAKQHKTMLDALKIGDQILTNGGIIGRITEIQGDMLTINIAKNVDITVGRGYVVSLVDTKVKESK